MQLIPIDREDLPIIIFGLDNSAHNEHFDSRNQFVRLIDCYDFPPVFKIQSLDGKHTIDRCFPYNKYRLATKIEIERLTNPNSNI